MLHRIRGWSATLVLVALAGCASGGDAADAQDDTFTEVIFEVPEGTGPEPAGDKEKEECATSCSLKKHPIPPFDELDFELARAKYAEAAPEAESEGLETLLFYPYRSRTYLDTLGYGELSDRHKSVLDRELSRTNARVSLRLVDESTETVRAVYGPNPVPIGQKQHLATVGDGLVAMEFNGTVMRTGVNYLWSRY